MTKPYDLSLPQSQQDPTPDLSELTAVLDGIVDRVEQLHAVVDVLHQAAQHRGTVLDQHSTALNALTHAVNTLMTEAGMVVNADGTDPQDDDHD